MSSRRFVLQWAAAGWLSCVAFVVLPPVLRPMAGSAPDLPTRARDALIEQWESGVVAPVPSMADLVAQWADYHLLKSAFAFLVVVALARVLGLLGRARPLLVGVTSPPPWVWSSDPIAALAASFRTGSSRPWRSW